VSPSHRHFGLYIHFHYQNISQVEVAIFLRDLLRHLRGHVIVILDGGSIHAGEEVKHVLARNSRLHVESFPAYAPELNPDEWVWSYFKGELANGRPDNVDELMETILNLSRKVQCSPSLIRSFVEGSDLPSFL
jgi:transposase